MLVAWATTLAVLAFVGFLDALYFVLVDRGLMKPDDRLVPPVCRMDEATCARIIETRYARVFGVPNAVFGLAWYLLVGGAASYALVEDAFPFCLGFLVVAAGTVALSVYLAWALLAKLKTVCVLCFAGHAVNLLIFGAVAGACYFP